MAFQQVLGFVLCTVGAVGRILRLLQVAGSSIFSVEARVLLCMLASV